MRTKLMKSTFLTGLLCAITLLPAIARADVVDDGGFFSPEAVAVANDALRAVEKKTGHTVRIETHATVPDGKAGAVSKMTGPDREKFFSNWLHDRAEAMKSRGLIVLICKEPAHLRLWAGTPLQNAGFGAVQAKQIREPLLAGFKAREYDKTLKESVTQITTVLEGLSIQIVGGGTCCPCASPDESAAAASAQPDLLSASHDDDPRLGQTFERGQQNDLHPSTPTSWLSSQSL